MRIMMKKVNIGSEISFKQLVSGPAPVGRILNYIRLTGEGKLKHKNESRNLYMKDGIGSAWTTEFMFGLGIIKPVSETNGVVSLELTPLGYEVYKRIKALPPFDEGKDAKKFRTQINMICPEVVPHFEKLFKESVVYEILCEYLKEYGYEYKKSDFLNGYFFEVQRLYDKSAAHKRTKKSIRTSLATTGANRVPSLVQLCVFFGYAEVLNSRLNFDPLCFANKRKIIKPTEAIIKKENRLVKTAEEIAKKYGFSGNVVREIVTRNSALQKIFRNNLLVDFECGCMICGIKCEEALIASHIKPAAQCNAAEKSEVSNGLLLCANHDRLFDRYLITFSAETGKIKISDSLDEKDRKLLGINEDICLDDAVMNEERKKYLKLHNAEFDHRTKLL